MEDNNVAWSLRSCAYLQLLFSVYANSERFCCRLAGLSRRSIACTAARWDMSGLPSGSVSALHANNNLSRPRQCVELDHQDGYTVRNHLSWEHCVTAHATGKHRCLPCWMCCRRYCLPSTHLHNRVRASWPFTCGGFFRETAHIWFWSCGKGHSAVC